MRNTLRIVMVAVVTVLLALCCSAAAIGCGGDSDPSDRYAERTRIVEHDPYAVTCADVNRHLANARLIRMTATRLAANRELAAVSRRLTFQRVVQSMDYALQAICRHRSNSFRPARAAIARVRDGTYRSTLCVGPGCE